MVFWVTWSQLQFTPNLATITLAFMNHPVSTDMMNKMSNTKNVVGVRLAIDAAGKQLASTILIVRTGFVGIRFDRAPAE